MTLFLLKDNNQIGQKTLSLNEAMVIYMRNYMFTYWICKIMPRWQFRVFL